MASPSLMHDLAEFFAELESLAKRYKNIISAREDKLSASGELKSLSSVNAVKKRKRPAKDPDAPKPPMSAYLMFSAEARKKLKEEHPEYEPREIMTAIASLWEITSDEDKLKYIDQHKEAREKWAREKDDYMKSKMVSQQSSHSHLSNNQMLGVDSLSDSHGVGGHVRDNYGEDEGEPMKKTKPGRF